MKDKREVKKEDAAAYADEHQLAFIETSALDMTNVDVAFDRIINGNISILALMNKSIEIYRVISTTPVLNEDEDVSSKNQAKPDKEESKTP